MTRLVALLLLSILAVGALNTGSDEDFAIVPLEASAIPEVLAPPADGIRIVMLWSLECAYCEPNMRVLADFQQRYPKRSKLLTIATENVSRAADIEARLRAVSMQHYPTYAYAGDDTTRFNFLIDPNWGGELPRTLILHADGTRTGISGKLTDEQLARIAPP